MASEMTSAFRDFAMKKLNEAKQRGATLATATAASITNNVPVPAGATSFVFRSNASRAQEREPLPVERKIAVLRQSNAALKKTATDHPSETLDDAIAKIDLVNESLAFTIENIQECSHVMKMLHRQLRDLGALRNADDLTFYRPSTAPLSSSSSSSSDPSAFSSSSTTAAQDPPSGKATAAVRFADADAQDYDY